MAKTSRRACCWMCIVCALLLQGCGPQTREEISAEQAKAIAGCITCLILALCFGGCAFLMNQDSHGVGCCCCCGMFMFFSLICLILGAGTYPGITCSNFKAAEPATCARWLESQSNEYGWTREDCCDPHVCSCNSSQEQLMAQTYGDSSECCRDLPLCKGFSQCQPGYAVISERYCQPSGCSSELCCASVSSCQTYPGCDHRSEALLQDNWCERGGCDHETCCQSLPSCNYDCGPGFQNVPTNYCLQSGCTQDSCCAPLPSCQNFTDCIRTDERIPNQFCDASGCTRETCCLSHNYTRSCLCEAPGEGLYCETGKNQNCTEAQDLDALWSCHRSKTMCVADIVCRPKVAGETGCVHHKTKEACGFQVHCRFLENTNLVHSWGCRGRGVEEGSALHDLCSSVEDKTGCDAQEKCAWNLTQAREFCENEGQWVGCKEKVQEATARCRKHNFEDACIADVDVCEWQGSCDCGPHFFGKGCLKQVVESNAEAQDFCVRNQSNISVCRGLVYASSKEERILCHAEGVQCGPWQSIKDAVASMREAEMGDIIVDSLSVFMLIVFLCFRCSGTTKFLFLASIANFAADIILEVRLIAVSHAAINAVATVRGSYCFFGDGVASLNKLNDSVENAVAYASANIGIAVLGALAEVIDTGKAVSMEEDEKMDCLFSITTGVVLLSAILELGIGVLSFVGNTQELIEEIDSMEAAVLGIKQFEEGHACFVRSAELKSTAATVGVEWNSFGFLIVPPILVLVIYSCACFCACACAKESTPIRYFSSY